MVLWFLWTTVERMKSGLLLFTRSIALLFSLEAPDSHCPTQPRSRQTDTQLVCLAPFIRKLVFNRSFLQNPPQHGRWAQSGSQFSFYLSLDHNSLSIRVCLCVFIAAACLRAPFLFTGGCSIPFPSFGLLLGGIFLSIAWFYLHDLGAFNLLSKTWVKPTPVYCDI